MKSEYLIENEDLIDVDVPRDTPEGIKQLKIDYDFLTNAVLIILDPNLAATSDIPDFTSADLKKYLLEIYQDDGWNMELIRKFVDKVPNYTR
jgi:hypothetical protein